MKLVQLKAPPSFPAQRRAGQSHEPEGGEQQRETATATTEQAPIGHYFGSMAVGVSRPTALIQPKLTINEPGDVYEQEADEVAEKIIQMHELAPPASPSPPNENSQNGHKSQRGIWTKGTRSKPFIQKAQAIAGVEAPTHFISQLYSNQGMGEPLPEWWRVQMEQAFSADFSKVRIHHDGSAARLSQDINARAFTFRNDIYFNQGQFEPGTKDGQRLLAHELTHVLQQDTQIRRDEGEVTYITLDLRAQTLRIITEDVPHIRTFQVRVRQRIALPSGNYRVFWDGTNLNVLPESERDAPLGGNIFYNLWYQSEEQAQQIRTLLSTITATEPAPLRLVGTARTAGSGETRESDSDDDTEGGATSRGPDTEPPPGVEVSRQASAEDIEFLRQIIREIFGEPEPRQEDDAPAGFISMADIEALRALDQDLHRAEIIAQFRAMLRPSGDRPGSSGHLLPSLQDLVEIARARQAVQEAGQLPGMALPEGNSSGQEPLVSRPVHGQIVNRSFPQGQARFVPNMETEFFFQVTDAVNGLRVPYVNIYWTAVKVNNDDTRTLVRSERTHYIEVRDQGLLNDRMFQVTFPATGNYEVHAVVYHNFYVGTNHFLYTPIEVKTETEQLDEITAQSGSIGSVARPATPHHFQDVTEEDFLVRVGLGVAMPLSLLLTSQTEDYSKGTIAEGTLQPELMTGDAFANSLGNLTRDIEDLEEMVEHHEGQAGQGDILRWAQERLHTLQDVQTHLEDLQRGQNARPIITRGNYISRTAGMRSGPLRLAAWFTYQATDDGQGGTFHGHLFDHSELVRTDHFHFEAQGDNYRQMMERLFFAITQTYPNGSMRFAFQTYERETPESGSPLLRPTNRYVEYERRTDTLLNDIQNVAFSQPVSIAVNVVSAVLTVFPPTAPIGIGVNLAYNGASTLLDYHDAATSGTVRTQNYVDIGLLALDIIPLLGRATRIARSGGTVLRLLEVGSKITEWSGEIYMFTDSAFHEVQQFRDGQISELARIQREIQLMRESPTADPQLIAEREADARRLQQEIRLAAVRIFTEMAENNLISLAAPAIARRLAQGVGGPHADGEGRIRQGEGGSSMPRDRSGDHPEGGSMPRQETPDAEEAGLPRQEPGISVRQRAVDTDPMLSDALPHDLRAQVPVHRIRTMSDGRPLAEADRTVRITYDPPNALGIIQNIRIEAGPGATRADIELHVATTRQMLRYSGLSGAVRVLSIRAANLIARHTRLFGESPPVGSRAWEAALEIEKLPGVIAQRMQELADNSADPVAAARSQEQIDFLQGEMARYQQALEDMDTRMGRGAVAADDILAPGARSGVAQLTEARRQQLETEQTQIRQSVSDDQTRLDHDRSVLRQIETLNAERTQIAQDRQSSQLERLREIQRQLRTLIEQEGLADAEDFTNDGFMGTLESVRRELGERISLGAQGIRTQQGRLSNIELELQPERYRAPLPCFAAGTWIWTPEGPKVIESFNPGDYVLTYDFEQRKMCPRKVLALHKGQTLHFYHLTTSDYTVLVTGEHPLWEMTSEKWITVSQLDLDCRILNKEGGCTPIEHISRKEFLTPVTSYNLSVDTYPYYFAGPGLLAHNLDPVIDSDGAIDVRLGGPHVIYLGMNPEQPDNVYVGRTDQGIMAREGQHRTQALDFLRLFRQLQEIRSSEGPNHSPAKQRITDQLLSAIGRQTRTYSEDLFRQLQEVDFPFFDFMQQVELHPLVRGLTTVEQARYLEQINIDIERARVNGQVMTGGNGQVMNRRDEAVTSLPGLEETVRAQLQGTPFCP